MNDIHIYEQPIPPYVAEACEWLSAAERHAGDPTNEDDIRAGLAAGEALDILTDVTPPYPVPREIHQPCPLADATQATLTALERALGDSTAGAGELLRIAKAVRVLKRHRQCTGM
ncbi:hypothetical protein G1H11_16185 [Phytoactinopolyspora alkaliphila]|uniref:Uncharacterized protein n=1 Tax=Phytoactinopolyspora alkaliphila TaxID=1783498 RepID=A0A6N9YP77_9ACTN|nr:hypothetical protein [Phytoactinopolyspora alkaliphila]NED96846.1 hypothetical protein [Phytoactinopolyspora alkaliphila]